MKILFLDRDGTLINEPRGGYIDSIKKLSLNPHIISSLQKLRSVGYKFVMVSNQPGLGTVKFPYQDFIIPQNELMKIFHDNDVVFEQTCFCPHFREDKCACMKPRTGLIDAYLKKNKIDMEKSYTVGDRESDVLLAQNIGCNSIFFSLNPHPGSVFHSSDWKTITEYILSLD
ncbi:MAG: histidinol-phosphatase [Patescibacteria group bacterium]